MRDKVFPPLLEIQTMVAPDAAPPGLDEIADEYLAMLTSDEKWQELPEDQRAELEAGVRDAGRGVCL
ncbi:hypothetical protein ACL02S_00080 [Nocardia sp. 004]|uniref:hypothetical protein n=1 Tax=Nocardia sp. 004 TaxID=3385978 RepID=UPI0039A2E274